MKITTASIVVASREQLSSSGGAETIVAGLRKGSYYALNAVAARVWELIQTPVRVSEVQARIAEEYDVSREWSERDVIALLERMAAEGLIDASR